MNAQYVKHITPKQFVEEEWSKKSSYAIFPIISGEHDPQRTISESDMAGRITDIRMHPLYGAFEIGYEKNFTGFYRRGSNYENQPSLAVYEITDYELENVMTASETAKLYGLSASAVRLAISRLQIPARKSAGTWLVRKSDAERVWGKNK
jgi:hypothetical protein